MAATKILLDCTDQKLIVAEVPVIASGGVNDNVVVITFSAEWNGLAKSAIFFTSNYKTIYEKVLTNDECLIPAEVLTEPGTIYIGVRGVDSGGAVVKTSTLVKFKIVPGSPPADGTTVEPTANVYQQILTAYGKNENAIAKEVAEREREVAVERSRIDALVKLENGSTTGDAELQDIRIGADGLTYDSAGTAVREQFSTLNAAFEESVNLFDKDSLTYDKFAFDAELFDGEGYYTSDFIEVKSNTFYVIPYTASVLATFFDENKNYLERAKREHYEQPSESYSIFKPNTSTKYVRVSGYMGNESPSVVCLPSEYMLVEGTVYPNRYIAYNGRKPTIKAECLNFDVNKWNVLYGKTLMTIGDSITEGSNIEVFSEIGYKMTYGGIVAYRNNMKFINKGWSGSTIADDGQKPFVHNGKIYVDLGEVIPDYLTIWYGWNDYAHDSITLGTIDDENETTFFGAWNVALNLLINKYPTTKIGIVIPYGMNSEWRDAVRSVAKKWGIPYLDLYDNESCIFDNETGVVSSVSNLRKSTFLADGTHPNERGYEWLSTIYEAFLRRL